MFGIHFRVGQIGFESVHRESDHSCSISWRNTTTQTFTLQKMVRRENTQYYGEHWIFVCSHKSKLTDYLFWRCWYAR